MTVKAHKIGLHLTPEQEAHLRGAAGAKRFVFKWGLAHWKAQYEG